MLASSSSRSLTVTDGIKIVCRIRLVIEVDDRVVIGISQESDPDVIAASNVLGSTGVVIVLLVSARESHVYRKAPEVGDINEVAWNTAFG